MSRLWNWLKGVFSTKEESSDDMFKPAERKIYHFWNGKDLIKVDPMPVYKRLMSVAPELSIDLKVASSISKDARTAHDAAIKTVRNIFSITPYEEGGLTEAEAMDLLDHFYNFCQGLKKKARMIPTPPTETSASSTPTVADTPTTESGLASGSTEKESSTAEPGQSPTGQALP